VSEAQRAAATAARKTAKAVQVAANQAARIAKVVATFAAWQPPAPPPGLGGALRVLQGAGYREIWAVDTEFGAPAGERPEPVCLVAKELITGRTIRLWRDELRCLSTPPYPVGDTALFIAYAAPAEFAVHLALGWPLPQRTLDLFVEFRVVTCFGGYDGDSGERQPSANLLAACDAFRIEHETPEEKAVMRDLVLRAEWTDDERLAVLNYCESDVAHLEQLLASMLRPGATQFAFRRAIWPIPPLDLTAAVERGRYMGAVARMEHTGIPIDVPALRVLQQHLGQIRRMLLARHAPADEVFGPAAVSPAKLGAFLARHGITDWPRTEKSGRLATDGYTFAHMAALHPVLQPICDAHALLGKLHAFDPAVGRDGRNRSYLAPFQTKTGRNAPAGGGFVFQPARWLRGLIRPDPGCGLIYLDYAQQEFAIAAWLSGDAAMQAAYLSGDPYHAFGVQSGLITSGMTEEQRKAVRQQCKALVLGLAYGKGPRALAGDLKVDEDTAAAFVANYWRTFGKFKAWSDHVVEAAWRTRVMRTESGWTQRVSARPNERSLRNWPIQSAGADILRRACCLLVEAGIAVCGPVHDAVLLEAPLGELDVVSARAAGIMGDAAEAIIGHRIRVGVETFRYPDRYVDEHGAALWRLVWETLGVDPDALDPAAAAFDAGEPTPAGDRRWSFSARSEGTRAVR
jgi:hypothetical protein